MIFRSVGQRSVLKVKPILDMLGKGALVFYKQLYFQYSEMWIMFKKNELLLIKGLNSILCFSSC